MFGIIIEKIPINGLDAVQSDHISLKRFCLRSVRIPQKSLIRGFPLPHREPMRGSHKLVFPRKYQASTLGIS